MKHEKKNGKTKAAAVVSAALAGALIIGGSLAMFTDHDNAVNKFSFLNDDGDQLVDVELDEPSWVEANGVGMLYGSPVAKDPQIVNNGEDSYGFISVVLPAEKVAIQNASGEIVDVSTGNKVTSLADAGLKTAIANNVTAKDIETVNDETEILGVYKDAELTEAYDYGEEMEAGSTVYFKLNSTATLGTASADGTYKVLEDTIDGDNYTSDTLGHQFMLKVVVEDASKVQLSELYATELKDATTGEAVRTNNISAKATMYDDNDTTEGDVDTADDVYSKLAYNTDKYVEITEKIPQKTLYYDAAKDQWYSAHVYFYKGVINAGETTDTLFDYIELVNIANGSINADADIDENVYVEAYAIQTSGLGDALGTTADNDVDGGVIIWNALTNGENGADGFNLFGVVEDTND